MRGCVSQWDLAGCQARCILRFAFRTGTTCVHRLACFLRLAHVLQIIHPANLFLQLIGRAVEALLRHDQQRKAAGGGSSGWGGVNVLCYGFRKRRPAGAWLVCQQLRALAQRDVVELHT